MPAPECLVFPDGEDWIVFAPATRIVMRTNAQAAERFRNFPDTGPAGDDRPAAATETGEFAPTYATISCTNMCSQKCVYCYGTPAHRNRSILDPQFCRTALEFVGANAKAKSETIRAFFHGVGEPTLMWPRFVECVQIVKDTGNRHEVAVNQDLCTGGQLSADQAQWIAENLDGVQVSIDGPPDIQNRQRPRLDGRDSLEGPLRLAQAVTAAGKRLAVKTTVTEMSVRRMVEIVEFVAGEIGAVRLDLGMMIATPWVNRETVRAPAWEDFVDGFEKALSRGEQLGVRVRHPTISFGTLLSSYSTCAANHFCLAPPNIVTYFYDVPVEEEADPNLGAYGWYDQESRSLHFDHAKRLRLEQEQCLVECQRCACRFACLGPGGVKGRMPKEIRVPGPMCQARLGVLKALLRRAVPRREATEEVAV